MIRPWQRWLVFAFCLAAVFGALGWMSVSLLQSEKTRSQMDQAAQREERIRLALWRMDSALTALIVEESARPASAYQIDDPAQLSHPSPSPLRNLSSPHIRLHFQRHPDGSLESPQIPGHRAGQPRLPSADVPPRLAELHELLDQPAVAQSFATPRDAGVAEPFQNWAVLVRESARQPAPLPSPSKTTDSQTLPNYAQQVRNSLELQSRANVFQQATQQAITNAQSPERLVPAPENPGALVFKAVWLGKELVLARRIASASGPVVQGVWLDWHKLQESLRTSVRDLLPSARLEPLITPESGDTNRRLAAIPALLVPGEEPAAETNPSSPLLLSLALAWVGVLGAALAAGVLLHGTLALSERRAAFVSAVTHELRTPLTTFKLYSEMLAEDMIPEPAQRKKYLATLCAEATRLGHLVENVLSYARLERATPNQHRETLSARQLVERIAPRLAERADQAGLSWVTETTNAAATRLLEIDVAAVEQILFNLVDNACKYAGPEAADKRLHLEILPAKDGASEVTLRLKDHGPGLPAQTRRRLFQPFSRSAAAAARGTPGVGLGLALCHRLSRSLGGSISLDPATREGAAFLLRLPAVPHPPQALTVAA